MITVKQEQARIAALIKLDNQTSDQLDQNTEQAIQWISQHLTVFYQHYAGENGLTVSQAAQNISKWDITQWKSAMAELKDEDWSPESKDRLNVLGMMAGMNLGSMFGAVAAMAVVRLQNKRAKVVQERMKQDVNDEIARMAQAFPAIKQANDTRKAERGKTTADTSKASKNEPLNQINGIKPSSPLNHVTKLIGEHDPSPRLWTDTDKLIADLQSSLFDSFTKVKGIQDFSSLFTQHQNPAQFDPQKSIADRIKQSDYVAERLLRSETAKMKDFIDTNTYKANGINWVNIVTEPGACVKCTLIADQGPYPIDSAPVLVDDTHPNCRCGKVPAMGADDSIDEPTPY